MVVDVEIDAEDRVELDAMFDIYVVRYLLKNQRQEE
jgi:hypothetical protein